MTGRSPRRSWMIGGSLLVASGVIVAAGAVGVGGMGWLQIAATLVASVAYFVFAFGVPDGGRVAGENRVGTASLAILAVWMLISAIAWSVPVDLTPVLDILPAISWADLLVQLALALVAASAIARAGAVPAPWHRAPLWAVFVTVLPAVITQVAIVAAPATVQQWAPALGALGAVVAVGVPVFLGVIAIVLSQRPVAERTVDVFSGA